MEGLAHARGSMIGAKIKKRFDVDGKAKWYKGIVLQHYEKHDQWRVLYEDGDSDDSDQKDVDDGKFISLKEPAIVFEKTPRDTDEVDETCLFSINGLIRDDNKADGLIPCYSKKINIKLLEFFLFMRERLMVRKRKRDGEVTKVDKQGNKSYSNSLIMGEWAFCNVHREHDRGTQFLKEHINEKFFDQGGQKSNLEDWVKTVLWKCYVYRQANRVESFLETGIPDPTSQSLEDFIQKFSQLQSPYFTGAHVRPPSQEIYFTFLRTTMKNDGQLLNDVAAVILEGFEIETNSDDHYEHCARVFQTLQRLDGIARFFAWQIMCDLSELGILVLHEKFVFIGLGAKSGIENIFKAGGQKRKLIFDDDKEQDQLVEYANQIVLLQDVIIKALGIDFPYWEGKRLGVKEIEHALCEFSKFCRGKTRAKYRTQCRFDESECFRCEREDDSNGDLCDTCNVFYCGACRNSCRSTSASWICSRCIAFQSHVWPDRRPTDEEQMRDPDGDDMSTNDQENQLQAETDSRKRKALSD